MIGIVNRNICLRLNSVWQPIGYGNVKDAITDLVSGLSVMAIDIRYNINEDGEPDLNSIPHMNPVDWDEWLTLPIRKWDNIIRSINLTIRVPTILISKNYSKMPMMNWKGKPTKDAIYIRDKCTCQYTGAYVDKRDASIDHVVPLSRGGNNDWSNVVLTTKKLNVKKGNKLNSEIGLKLIKQPNSPKPVPISSLIRESKHPDWLFFIQP